MNRKSFLLLFLAQWLLWAIVKVWLFNNQVFVNLGAQQVLFWILTLVITAAVIRRFGYISLLEMAVVGIVWTLAGLLLDLIFTSKFTGLGMFNAQAFWDGYGVMIASVFVFHKKKHIFNRHKLRAAKRAAQQAAAHPQPPQMPEVNRQ